MDKAIKARWVEKLRSGDYEQGRVYLHDRDDKFCCLGVLCEIAVEDGVATSQIVREGRTGYKGLTGVETISLLPVSVAKWARIDEAGTYDPKNKDGKLVIDNDSGGKSFLEIADIIEKRL